MNDLLTPFLMTMNDLVNNYLVILNDLMTPNYLLTRNEPPGHEWPREKRWPSQPRMISWPWMTSWSWPKLPRDHKWVRDMNFSWRCIISWPPDWLRDPEWPRNSESPRDPDDFLPIEWPHDTELLRDLAWPLDHIWSARESGWELSDRRCDGAADGLVGDHLRGYGGGKGKSGIIMLHFRHLWTPAPIQCCQLLTRFFLPFLCCHEKRAVGCLLINPSLAVRGCILLCLVWGYKSASIRQKNFKKFLFYHVGLLIIHEFCQGCKLTIY